MLVLLPAGGAATRYNHTTLDTRGGQPCGRSQTNVGDGGPEANTATANVNGSHPPE